MAQYLAGQNVVLVGFPASLAAGLMTGAGALLIVFFREVSEGVLDGMLGFAAGVMLAATSFSLIVPGIEEAGGGVYGASVVAAGVLLGGLFLLASDRYAPHRHFVKGYEGASASLKRIWLFVIAIALHNFPEGRSVGVVFGQGGTESIRNGLSLAVGIGLQNAPEGFGLAPRRRTLEHWEPQALERRFGCQGQHRSIHQNSEQRLYACTAPRIDRSPR